VTLSNSDLSKQLSQSLAALSDVHKKARKLEEEQSQDDIILLMGTGEIYQLASRTRLIPGRAVDEYIRLIGSVRVSLSLRVSIV
jgi:Vps5 C terminal like